MPAEVIADGEPSDDVIQSPSRPTIIMPNPGKNGYMEHQEEGCCNK